MKIVIFLSLFSFCASAPSNSVPVAKVKLHCKLEITSKVECFLPQNTQLTDVIEITSSIAFTTSGLSDDEVRNAKELEINYMYMTEHMPFKIGDEFRLLKALWIVRSPLRMMSSQNFDQMLQLRALNLYENQIDSLSSDVFHRLANLEYLDLDNNQISDLHSDLFIYMPDLTVLRMRANNLEKLSQEIFKNNQKLEEIHLNENKLKQIDVDFNSFENLLAVNLEGNFRACDLSVGFLEDAKKEEDDFYHMMRVFQWEVERKCRVLS